MSEAVGIAPVVDAAPANSSAAEPSMEALAALIPDPTPGQPAKGEIPVPPLKHEDAEAAKAKAEAEEKAKEEQKEEPEKPEEETAAQADKEALERAEAAAKKAREGSRRYRETLEAQRKVQAEAERAFRQAAEDRRQAEEAKKFQDELRRDPYAALKRLGMTDQELAERALREGTPEQEMRVALQQQQEALKIERQRIQQLEEDIRNERQAQVRQKAEADFHRLADDERSYPRLSQLSPAAQLAVAQAALQQIANNGYDVGGLADTEVAEACEQFLAPKKAAKAAPAAKSAPAATTTPKTNTTLTNAVSTTRATAPRPWEDMTDDEQLAAIAASLPDPS
jgi:hypothetical protein